ncbi:hypothetical protein [Bradyrhizobium sp. I1.7.5]|uniref:hypothetical protein n=1 Tax=Bradyrhizobium sp. I1.7.5 TaxID=3156363 RepID=UPI00339B88C2
MRPRQIAAGTGTADEIYLMVAEKLDAAEEARTIFMRGGDSGEVITTEKSWPAMSSVSAGKSVGPA